MILPLPSLTRRRYGDLKAFVAVLPVGELVNVPLAEARALRTTAWRLRLRSSMRKSPDSSRRIFKLLPSL